GHALAQPELATTARTAPGRAASTSRSSVTGAATTRLVVKTPAAEHGRSEAISVRSSRPLAFSPQVTPAERKPGASANSASGTVSEVDAIARTSKDGNGRGH